MQCPSVWVCPTFFLMVRLSCGFGGGRPQEWRALLITSRSNGAHPRCHPCDVGHYLVPVLFARFSHCKVTIFPLPPLFSQKPVVASFPIKLQMSVIAADECDCCRWVIKLQMSDQVVKVGSGRHRRGKWVQEGLFLWSFCLGLLPTAEEAGDATVTRSDIQQGTEFLPSEHMLWSGNLKSKFLSNR